MTATRIIIGLERSDTKGAEADAIARLGFLEWAFAHDGAVTAADAELALKSPEALGAGSDAARAFVGFLNDAAQTMHVTPTRRRSRRHMHS